MPMTLKECFGSGAPYEKINAAGVNVRMLGLNRTKNYVRKF